MRRHRSVVRVIAAVALCLYLGAFMVFLVDIATSLRTLADAMHPFKVWVAIDQG